MAPSPDSSEYCNCPAPKGYCSIRDEFNIFVHSDCLKPSFPIWDYYWKLCEECGRGFSSPWELICSFCKADFLATEGEGTTEGFTAWLNLTQPNWWYPGWSRPFRSWGEQREWTLRNPFVYREESLPIGLAQKEAS